jgi:hypothetical protein
MEHEWCYVTCDRPGCVLQWDHGVGSLGGSLAVTWPSIEVHDGRPMDVVSSYYNHDQAIAYMRDNLGMTERDAANVYLWLRDRPSFGRMVVTR